MSPYKTFGCSICGMQAPKELREHGTFAERMKWLRSHRKKYHPELFKKSIKKGVKTRKESKVTKKPCPGSKIRSKGKGRGLGRGKGEGPLGVPYKNK